MDTQAIIFMIIGLGIPYTGLTLALRRQFKDTKDNSDSSEESQK